MSRVTIESLPDDRYRITDGTLEFSFDRERFEDLYYAVPTHPTQFYRLLTDQVSETQAQRDAINTILESSGEREAALRELMDQIQALPEP